MRKQSPASLKTWGHTFIDANSKVILSRVIVVARTRKEALALLTGSGFHLKSWEFKYWIETGDATECAVAGAQGEGVYRAPHIGKYEEYKRVEKTPERSKVKIWGHLMYAARLFEKTKNGFVYKRKTGEMERATRIVVAATSKKQAVELLRAVGFHVSQYEFDGYWCRTGNATELLVVEQHGIGVYGAPGVEFPTSVKEYRRMEPKPKEVPQ